ncbi:hypothetical protein HYQ46_007531 [Verticillium longisporum]|nr:hypothetical protein HYQ46_007531 [Verticillium longisporum]
MKIRQITTCHTCRARKLACDGKTPACTQCTKSGRECAGYQHDLIFRPPTMMASNSNLLAAATMCLFLSEMVLPTSNSSAPIHAKGIGDLLQLHEPDFYSSGISHQLFVGFRPVMFIHVFMSRQKSFLAETQWLHAPFSESGAAPLQNLFSEMMNMPVTVGVVEGLDTMPLEQAQFAAQNALHNFEIWVRQLVNLREAQGDGGQYQCFSTEPPRGRGSRPRGPDIERGSRRAGYLDTEKYAVPCKSRVQAVWCCLGGAATQPGRGGLETRRG